MWKPDAFVNFLQGVIKYLTRSKLKEEGSFLAHNSSDTVYHSQEGRVMGLAPAHDSIMKPTCSYLS